MRYQIVCLLSLLCRTSAKRPMFFLPTPFLRGWGGGGEGYSPAYSLFYKPPTSNLFGRSTCRTVLSSYSLQWNKDRVKVDACAKCKTTSLRGLFNLRCHHSLKKRTSHLSNLKLLHPLEVFSVGSDAKFKPPTPILKRPLVVGFRQTGQL